MDAQARDELREQCVYQPMLADSDSGRLLPETERRKMLAPFEEETVWAVIEGWRDRAGEFLGRGIANAFSGLDPRFKSHDGFKVGARIIFKRLFDFCGMMSCRSEEKIFDVERLFHVLDGKAIPERYAEGGLIKGIKAAKHEQRGWPKLYEGEYFSLRMFQNTNAHVWFTRPDLVKEVNLILAAYYGASLGYGRDMGETPEAVFENALARSQAKGYGFFPTSDEVADRLIEEVRYDCSGPVLEPSAGTGQLSSRAAALGLPVDVIEIQPELCAELRQSGLYRSVQCRNFLEIEPVEKYGTILMNPPFDQGRDCDHVQHAIKFLRPGGLLLAIMSAGAAYNETPRAKALRKMMGKRSYFVDLPAGSFRHCGTNVNTVVLHYSRPRKW